MNKRILLIVLDSVGIGELPDAAEYGDAGSNTLKHIYAGSDGFRLENLEKLGLTNITGTDFGEKHADPCGGYGKMQEVSPGKDTTTGHWEIAGLYLDRPFSVFPDGFDDEIIREFTKRTGYEVLCNKPYSGTEVIKDYGEEHMRTKKLIVYTSADSVFQIAAHEQIVPAEELYDICRTARELLDPYYVSRVIARPFTGDSPDSFVRTSDRRDFSVLPPGKTLLDALTENNISVYGIGKIEDIFAGRGISFSVHTESNLDGINQIIKHLNETESGLIFANLVDFDSVFGHRNNVEGYAQALLEFDSKLPEIINAMSSEDIMIITADHGCDPSTESTDHSREYVPLLIYKKNMKPADLGIRSSFADIAAAAAEYFGIDFGTGNSFLSSVTETLPH